MDTTTFGGPILGGGFKSNGDFSEGSLFLVEPLLNTIDGGSSLSGDLLFAEPYLTWGSGGELGASLGVGYRHLFSNQTAQEAASTTAAGLLTEGFFIGANSFLDYARTRSDSNFWQAGFGLEAGTRYLEIRANYYLPLGDDEVVSRSVSSQSSTSTSSRNVGSVRRTTTTRTTTRTVTEIFEEGMEGWDIEGSLLVPGVDRYFDMRLVAGYYDFKADRSSASDFSGWRAGVEVRPVSSMVVFAHWYDTDNFYGDDWIAGVRFEIPLGGNRKGAFDTRRRHLAERLFEPVRRQNSSITTTGTVSEVVSQQTTSSSSTTSHSIAPPPPPPPPGGSEEQEK